MLLAALASWLVLVAPATSEPAADPSPATEPAGPVAPEDPAELAAQAEQAFGDGRFEDVVDLAGRAYALTGDPRHLYAQALAERRLAHCREALIFYARVLASVRDDPAYSALVTDTRRGIELCEDELEPPPEPAPAPAPVVDPVAPEPEPAQNVPLDRSLRPWHRDPWGGAMLGVGVGIAAGGGVLWGLSAREARALRDVRDETAYANGLGDARALRAGAIAALAVGGALLVGATVRYVLVRRRSTSRSTRPLALEWRPSGVPLRLPSLF